MKIGVFDSGVGGLSVVNAISLALPNHEVVYKEDRENVPYGDKSVEQLKNLVLPIMQQFVDEGCDVVVLACNTVTTNLAEEIRSAISIPVIGMEPMVKPAAQASRSNTIAVCATPMTLQSKRYKWLKSEYAPDTTVLEPDCSEWAYMIEANQINHQKIDDQISDLCQQGADVIVLGCTHYHWIEQDIQNIANRYGATVIQPEEAVVSRLKTVLAQLA